VASPLNEHLVDIRAIVNRILVSQRVHEHAAFALVPRPDQHKITVRPRRRTYTAETNTNNNAKALIDSAIQRIGVRPNEIGTV
jgi:hypothetical protein